jgi:hypothetical protein
MLEQVDVGMTGIGAGTSWCRELNGGKIWFLQRNPDIEQAVVLRGNAFLAFV